MANEKRRVSCGKGVRRATPSMQAPSAVVAKDRGCTATRGSCGPGSRSNSISISPSRPQSFRRSATHASTLACCVRNTAVNAFTFGSTRVDAGGVEAVAELGRTPACLAATGCEAGRAGDGRGATRGVERTAGGGTDARAFACACVVAPRAMLGGDDATECGAGCVVVAVWLVVAVGVVVPVCGAVCVDVVVCGADSIAATRGTECGFSATSDAGRLEPS